MTDLSKICNDLGLMDPITDDFIHEIMKHANDFDAADAAQLDPLMFGLDDLPPLIDEAAMLRLQLASLSEQVASLSEQLARTNSPLAPLFDESEHTKKHKTKHRCKRKPTDEPKTQTKLKTQRRTSKHWTKQEIALINTFSQAPKKSEVHLFHDRTWRAVRKAFYRHTLKRSYT